MKDAEKIYTAIPDIVDYYYAETEGKSLGDLSSIIELALSHGKLKTQALKQLEVSKKELKTPEQKIEFYRFLKDCDVSITDFNAIAGKSFIENPQHDILDQLINKKYLSECIQELKGCKKEDAEEFYRGFTDVINATYDEETGDLENLSTIIDIANKYNIKNSDGILRLYNDATKQNKKSMTTEELCNFIDLFKYSDAKNILEDAKRQKVKAIDLLTAEKQAFEKIKQEIEDYIQNDDSAYFAGESALSIYKKYTKLFKDANDSVFTILEIISGKDTQAAEKQKQKEESINAFSKYFSSKEETLNFINANQIKFETKQREIEYKDNCITILNALLSTQNADEKIEYFTNSGFLTKSKNRLNEFLAKTPQAKTRQEVLSIIAEKKIPSINHLEKFLHDFGTDNNSDIKLLEFLRNLPDNIDFTECLQILNNLQKKLNNLNLPIQITADNINRIDLSEYKSSNKIQSQEIAALLDKMLLPTQGKNFLTALPDSTQKTTNKISAYKIAKELAFNLDNSQESYHNLTRILGLSKSSLNLTADISTYLYIDAILEKLPQEFIDFVNSDDWLKYSDEEGKEIPNVSLHARLRAIDRFALNGIDDINELYSEETKEKLRNLFRSVYTQTPIDIKGTEQTKQIVANHMHNSVVLETVFSPKGKLVTIVQKRK